MESVGAATATLAEVTQESPPASKVALFRSLFKGREDLFARRFESKRSGKSGYQPACLNEWRRGLCDKPKISCGHCKSRLFIPLSDVVVAQHLKGFDLSGNPFVMGLYPLLSDETCHLLAIDLDRAAWQEDAAALLEAGDELGIPLALERSRSGRGAHLWIFFKSAVPARLARELGAALLTAAAARRNRPGLDSYDRLFPNQDTMPAGGFGNLIALPLQKSARSSGNTLFLDHSFLPHNDQWAYLARLRRLALSEVEAVVAERRGWGGILGVALPSEEESQPHLPHLSLKRLPDAAQPACIKGFLRDRLYLERNDLSPPLTNRLVRLAAFQNPLFYRAQARRQNTYNIPRIISSATVEGPYLLLPRGTLTAVEELARELAIELEIEDRRNCGTPLKLEFNGELRPAQHMAAHALLKHDTGVLAATTAFGKTVVAAWLIARRGVNTLVLVHRRHLQQQWIARLATFLNLDASEIGSFGGGKKVLHGRLDVALLQSMSRRGTVDPRIADYGQIIIDECHVVSANSFEEVVRAATARYILGLSATPLRHDGQHPLIFMQCGPIRHRVSARQQALQHPFDHLVKVRPTTFIPSLEASAAEDGRRKFQAYSEELTRHQARNRLICDEVVAAVEAGRSPVLITERVAHLLHLEEALRPRLPAGTEVLVLRGGYGRKQLAALQERLTTLPRETPRLLLATGRYLGEGFDDARLDTLFLAFPVSWQGVVAQYAGRLHRLDANKHEVHIYDYADLNVPLLARMFDRRCKGYEALGYRILLPPSLGSGWPPEVELPVDPRWNESYADSVRRLLRDGIDTPLADLFLHATHQIDTAATTPDGARSPVETFLYRRLETLPVTAGRFQLNARLPISFGEQQMMEVDFLCQESRLVVEIDGRQHLQDEVAWRRDRMKDLLLQEHGYFVIRFLAGDVVRRLDRTLDTLLRIMQRRTNQTVSLLDNSGLYQLQPAETAHAL